MNKTSSPCLNPSDVNITLKKTFEFIESHQLTGGALTTTEVVMSTNLLANQFSSTTTPQEAATHKVIGEIFKVYDTYLIISSKNYYSSKPSFYFISFTRLLYLTSSVITNNFSEYIKFMCCLPKLCDSPDNADLVMINRITNTLTENADSNLYLQYIYDGIRSDNYSIKDYLFVKNLLTLDKFYIIPITSIDGYALIPIC